MFPYGKAISSDTRKSEANAASEYPISSLCIFMLRWPRSDNIKFVEVSVMPSPIVGRLLKVSSRLKYEANIESANAFASLIASNIRMRSPGSSVAPMLGTCSSNLANTERRVAYTTPESGEFRPRPIKSFVINTVSNSNGSKPAAITWARASSVEIPNSSNGVGEFIASRRKYPRTGLVYVDKTRSSRINSRAPARSSAVPPWPLKKALAAVNVCTPV